MRKLTEREEIGEGRVLLHGHILFHLPPLGSPIELAQSMCAVSSGISAKSINLRLGEAWGPDEVSWMPTASDKEPPHSFPAAPEAGQEL